MKTVSIFTPYLFFRTFRDASRWHRSSLPACPPSVHGPGCVRTESVFLPYNIILEDPVDPVHGDPCHLHGIGHQYCRFGSHRIALNPLQSVERDVQSRVREHRIHHGLVSHGHGDVIVRFRYLGMYLIPVIGRTVSFSRQTSGPGNRTFMFLQTYRKDGHGACLGFGHFQHPVTTYDSLPAIRKNKSDSGLRYALTGELRLQCDSWAPIDWPVSPFIRCE